MEEQREHQRKPPPLMRIQSRPQGLTKLFSTVKHFPSFSEPAYIYHLLPFFFFLYNLLLLSYLLFLSWLPQLQVSTPFLLIPRTTSPSPPNSCLPPSLIFSPAAAAAATTWITLLRSLGLSPPIL